MKSQAMKTGQPILMSFVCLCAAVVAQAATCEDATLRAVPQTLSFATNNWGRDFAAYKSDIAKLSDCVTAARNGGRALDFGEWYLTLASLSVPTNDINSYRCWLTEKSFLLGTTARYLHDASHTNCWMAVATQLGEVRLRKRTREQILGELQSPDFDGKVGGSIAARRKWLRRELSLQSSLARAEEDLCHAVVETVGCRFLPRLEEHAQQVVLSNLVALARLKAAETKQIENAIEVQRKVRR